ncbi:hypothetical protein CDIK_0781 [Cucumispora dikerogammari]|nr:hypothetical protein CDIK_0781 [Cucumispora dikerogammari]
MTEETTSSNKNFFNYILNTWKPFIEKAKNIISTTMYYLSTWPMTLKDPKQMCGLITSNELQNLPLITNQIYPTLEDFQLRDDYDGDSILFPIFELKWQNGKVIEAEFADIIDFNEIKNVNGILQSKHNIDIDYEQQGSSKIQRAGKGNFFIFPKPSSKNLHLYLLLSFPDDKKLVPELDKGNIDYIKFCLSIDIKNLITINFGERAEKIKRYTFDIPKKLLDVTFSINLLKLVAIEISHTNNDNTPIFIKPLRSKNTPCVPEQVTYKETLGIAGQQDSSRNETSETAEPEKNVFKEPDNHKNISVKEKNKLWILAVFLFCVLILGLALFCFIYWKTNRQSSILEI